MKSRASARYALTCAAAAAAALCMCGPASAAPAKARPTLAEMDPGNLSGVWERDLPDREARNAAWPTRRADEGGPVPMRPWVEEVLKKRMQDAKDGRPYASSKARCLPAGLPRSMDVPNQLPLQIIFSPGQVTILFEEFDIFRIIHMGGEHPKELEPTFFGDSRGHWEGDTLVIDSVGFREDTILEPNGTPHSDAMHIVERIRRTGSDSLEDILTIDDPKAFTKPWVFVNKYKTPSEPGRTLEEYYCVNQRNAPDANGAVGVQMRSADQ